MAKTLVDMLLDAIFDDEWVGRRGEKLTARELKLVRLFGRKGKILRNVYVPKPDGTTSEIDLLYLSEKGIFIIESKNYSGWIFGSEDQFKWTVSLPGGYKERFYNPIKQNRGHAKWLDGFLGEDVPLFPIVAFSERCELKKVTVTSLDVKVVKRDRLYAAVRDIWDASPSVLDEDDVENLLQRLLPLTDKTKAEKAAHVRNVKNHAGRWGASTPHPDSDPASETVENGLPSTEAGTLVSQSAPVPACPRCGSPMVLRTAKRGAREGKQFWGCSTYPRCRGIVNIDHEGPC